MRAYSVQFRRELAPIVISNKVLVSSVNKPLMPGLVDQINFCSFTPTDTQNRFQERDTR